MQGGAVGIGRAGRGRTECRHWTEDRGFVEMLLVVVVVVPLKGAKQRHKSAPGDTRSCGGYPVQQQLLRTRVDLGHLKLTQT